MKRQIKFRGYNLKNNKWLYGYYLVNRGKHYIVQDEEVNPFSEPEDFEVDPESVGQYVGEINGMNLYEGDYVYDEESKVELGFGFACECEQILKEPIVLSRRLLYRCYKGEELEYELKGMVTKTYTGYVHFGKEYKVVANEYEERLKKKE